MKRLIALTLACVSLPSMAQAQTPAAADMPGKTGAGVTYVQPKSWTAVTRGPATVFTAPEADLAVAFVEVGSAATAQAAVDRAWSLYRAGASPVQRLASPEAPRSGWEERVAFAYETPPNAKAVASALAMRKGTGWTVMIVDGAQRTADKRQAAISLLGQTVRPAGYQRENFAGRAAHRLTPERVALMRAFVEQSLRELEVPGAGVALIDGGKVVWQGGVGVKRLGSAEPVTAHSKFMIASNTKGMSTLLLATLADQGKLRWDQPVTKLYPAFRLGDDATTRATLVRHLVCACTGLPRKDFAFILASPDTPAIDTFRQLAATQPTSRFGEIFQYNNLMASAAGYLGGHLLHPTMELGAAYDRAMQERIFGPMGMRDTSFTNANAMTGDWARPYGRDVDGRVVELANSFNDTIRPYRPAGGAWSSAADMARYVQLELGKGMLPEGKRIVSEENILERRKPGVLVGEDKYYGMGLFNETDWGVNVVDHGGTLQGYRSNFYVLPDAGIGAVLLTNADDGAALTAPFLRRLLEVVYDGQPEAAAEVSAAAARAKASARARRARLTWPGDPAVLANLAARYREPEIGELTIRKQDGRTWIKAGSIDSPLATRVNADGSVSVVTAGPGAIGMEAVVGGTPGARTLTIRDSQHEYVYTEVS
ncbi:serine hydrolase domain-containing protein [Sphingomonas sp. CROZ-RG-20F-R02-07]|uniref:serine hydrolase domain-containing protein n=1 Tax=Sphingomonas sp. CROZ-RG-20F-R02-07 TaxID=2914832 RepID=UPI001F5908CA|nr:serine hydrolase domain-containing protein [Sphingomonas sp. CROZ-RG-20F-R02-07]